MAKKQGQRDVHVYLEEQLYEKLTELAKGECRSISGQAELFIRQGLSKCDKGPELVDDPLEQLFSLRAERD